MGRRRAAQWRTLLATSGLAVRTLPYDTKAQGAGGNYLRPLCALTDQALVGERVLGIAVEQMDTTGVEQHFHRLACRGMAARTSVAATNVFMLPSRLIALVYAHMCTGVPSTFVVLVGVRCGAEHTRSSKGCLSVKLRIGRGSMKPQYGGRRVPSSTRRPSERKEDHRRQIR